MPVAKDTRAGAYASDPLHMLLNEAGPTTIPYRPILKQMLGDTNAAILLQQVVYYYIIKGREPFWKFHNPAPDHPLYYDGDSWTEVLGFTDDEFKHALKKIATRVKKAQVGSILADVTPQFSPSSDGRCRGPCKKRKVLVNSKHLVVYWRNVDNTTRYLVNEQLLINAVTAYRALPKAENPTSDSGISGVQIGKNGRTYNRKGFKDLGGENVSSFTQASRLRETEDDGDSSPKTATPISPSGQDEIDHAIESAWGTIAPAMIALLRTTLLGQHPPNKKHWNANVIPPATAQEIEQFVTYYDRVTNHASMPTEPAKIQHWITKFRQLRPANVIVKGIDIPLRIKVPPERDTPRKALNYIREFFPEEHRRVFQLAEDLTGQYGPLRALREGYFDIHGEKVFIQVPIPERVYTGDKEDFWEYLRTNHPDEHTRLQSEFRRIEAQYAADKDEVIRLNTQSEQVLAAKRRKVSMRNRGARGSKADYTAFEAYVSALLNSEKLNAGVRKHFDKPVRWEDSDGYEHLSRCVNEMWENPDYQEFFKEIMIPELEEKEMLRPWSIAKWLVSAPAYARFFGWASKYGQYTESPDDYDLDVDNME